MKLFTKLDHNVNNNFIPLFNTNNKCLLINIVWIDRGIKLTIIYNILHYYSLIRNKIIIIDNYNYRKFAKIIFPELYFSKYKNHNEQNFYFNIRSIIKKQDIIIDYINNYTIYIPTDKIILVPWYDMNDPLISFYYNKKKKLKIIKFKYFINNFSKCKRGLYLNNILWDIFIENIVFKKYIKYNKNINIQTIFNKLVLDNYISGKIEYPIIYYYNNMYFLYNYIKTLEQKYKVDINYLTNKLLSNNQSIQTTNNQSIQTTNNQSINNQSTQTINNFPHNLYYINKLNKIKIKHTTTVNKLIEIFNKKIEDLNYLLK